MSIWSTQAGVYLLTPYIRLNSNLFNLNPSGIINGVVKYYFTFLKHHKLCTVLTYSLLNHSRAIICI